MPKYKTTLMDSDSVYRTLRRLSHEIVEKNHGCDDLCIVGILRRGGSLARIIADNIKKIEDVDVPVGSLDISLYRDDIEEMYTQPVLNSTNLPFDVNNKKIVLVDDVLYTGRTTRAAMDAIINMGRPSSIRLAVLVDRGHRELPICGNFVGKNFPTSKNEMIKVYTDEYDGETKVDLFEQ